MFKLVRKFSKTAQIPRISLRHQYFISNIKMFSTNSVVFDAKLLKYLDSMKERYSIINNKLSSSTLSPDEMSSLGKEYSQLSKLVSLIEDRERKQAEILDLLSLEKEENHNTESDNELLALAKAEREEAEAALIEIEENISGCLVPDDSADDRGVIVEIRTGTGGDEASLFANEIYKMYQKLSIQRRWKWEDLSISKTEVGGLKEAQVSISGDEVFKNLKFEAGVHRVQRVPINDVRVQTSAISVIILPEASEIDVDLKPQDLRIDVYRAGGAGGQHVNTTESAVRITHLPTGCVVAIQDERSQLQNKTKAMKYLRARVFDLERQKAMKERQDLRSAAQGTGDRSDKVRTYNFPQDRVTDHRISLNVSGVERVLNAESLPMIIDELTVVEKKDLLHKFLENLAQN